MVERLIVIPALLAACGAPRVEEPPAATAAVTSVVAEPVDDDLIEESTVEGSPTGEALAAVGPVDTLDTGAVEATEPHPVSEVARYALRRGETPAHFARWSGLPVEVIAELSGLELDGAFPVGTEVRVPVAGERRAQLELARQAHHARRAEGYLASRGGAAGTEFYTVKTGDTAWSIALDLHGIPVWLLESYNPSVDLEALRPGQELMVPVLADVVVDAGAP